MASTYNDKIAKYYARVNAAKEVGVEPRDSDVRKLQYFLGRATKKGGDHKVKFKDKRKLAGRKAKKVASKALPELLKAAAQLLALAMGYEKLKQLERLP